MSKTEYCDCAKHFEMRGINRCSYCHKLLKKIENNLIRPSDYDMSILPEVVANYILDLEERLDNP